MLGHFLSFSAPYLPGGGTFSAAVKQHKDVYEYIFKEEENSQKGWAGAKLCSEAHGALTRVTAWSETDWSGRNSEGMGKKQS